MNPKMSYFSNAGDEALPTELTITEEGHCTLLVRTNRGLPEQLCAGVFETDMKERKLRALSHVMSSKEFEDIATPEGVQPGDVVRKLSIQPEGGERTTRYAVSGKTAAPVFVTAEQEAMRVAAQVSRKPTCAVALDAVEIPQRINRGEKARVSFSLRNIGEDPLNVPHPKAWQAQAVQVQLAAVRSDVQVADLRGKHQVFEQLTGLEVINVDGPTDSEEALKIRGGQSVAFTIEKTFGWAVGKYDVKLTYEGPLFDEDKEVIRCEIVTKPYPAACLGAGAPAMR